MDILDLIVLIFLWSGVLYCLLFILHILRLWLIDYLYYHRNNDVDNNDVDNNDVGNENIQHTMSSNNNHTVIINPNNSIYIGTSI